jgi:hypothetical protein
MSIEQDVKQSTQLSGVPLKVEEQQALLEIGRLIEFNQLRFDASNVKDRFSAPRRHTRVL